MTINTIKFQAHGKHVSFKGNLSLSCVIFLKNEKYFKVIESIHCGQICVLIKNFNPECC